MFDASSVKINEEDYLGKSIPNIKIKDENGAEYRLDKFSGKPLVLSIIYYRCAASCPILNEGLAEALSGMSGLKLGEDYNVLTLSFRSEETIEDAKKFKKRTELKMKDKLPEGFNDWLFAVSNADDIKQLTDALGFRFFYSEQDQIYVHPNVYIFVSPKMTITRYMFGLFPQPEDIKIALLEAADGKIGRSSMINTLTLACFKYDASIGGYRLNLKFIFAMFGLSLGGFTGIVVFLYARKIKKQRMAV
ncbi:SCO1/SenC/PrrC family protein [Candidatus Magnetoovum chiemensis]|nr:SCO1/SenC/PrrC family protein [Candidatus Magnetoovum chiemensis]